MDFTTGSIVSMSFYLLNHTFTYPIIPVLLDFKALKTFAEYNISNVSFRPSMFMDFSIIFPRYNSQHFDYLYTSDKIFFFQLHRIYFFVTSSLQNNLPGRTAMIRHQLWKLFLLYCTKEHCNFLSCRDI